jgi:DNA mismatch repair protein MutL
LPQINVELADIIHLLPDNIANQIAAGEVIQRPASAVKELLENSVDAGATEIRLFVNDAGKSLVQVIDNGKGMSETDGRMCFERHATSKIRNIDDLFHIRTMGFRGEALASIAAVAQVELKTKKAGDEAGTLIEIDNSVVRRQEPVACADGTSISMKNLFFNVPARRNFLKSNAAEMRHIVDEFIRVALAFPQIFFSLTSNGQQIFHLERGTLKQRIVQILGNQYAPKLVSVHEKTDYLNITGFVGKPETAKKTRGDQYFFVNNRFIRSAYLNHAVMSAYQEMIAGDSYPLYVLFIDLNPEQVDVNVHPTKQEIKFEDEKIVYAFVQAAVKHALAQFSITPTLDFDLDPSIQHLEAVSKPVTEEKRSSVAASSIYQSFTQKNQAHFIEPEIKHWDHFFDADKKQAADLPESGGNYFEAVSKSNSNQLELNTEDDQMLMQLMQTYIIASTNRGFILVHQQLAHERILYEKYLEVSRGGSMAVQRSLFPVTLQFSTSDSVIMQELLPDLHQLGYHIEPFGKDAYVIQGTPADVGQGNEKLVIEMMLEQYKHFSNDVKFSKREKLIRSLSSQHSVKTGTALTKREMSALLEELFNCLQPNMTPAGIPTYIEFKREYLEQLFRK